MNVNSSQRFFPMKSSTQRQLEEYKSRVNNAIDFIESNLSDSLSLDSISQAANFSKYHFHRIFHAMIGETPFQFINRIRLERAASQINTLPQKSISEIAFDCGFSDLSVFSRNFKQYFAYAPSAYRENGPKNSNIHQVKGNLHQIKYSVTPYFCSHTKTLKWRTNMELLKNVEVKTLPKMTLAYIRHTGPYAGDGQLFERLYQKLFTWAGPRKLLEQPDLKSIVVYHDDPNVTDEQKLRMSVSITVPEHTKVDGEFGKMEIDEGKYVVASFQLNTQQYGEAWSWLYGSWFPQSGYQPDDGACFEMYTDEPEGDQMKVNICVPVKPL